MGGFYLPWVQRVGRRCPWFLSPPAQRRWRPQRSPLPVQHQLRTVPRSLPGVLCPSSGVETRGPEHSPLPRPAFAP